MNNLKKYLIFGNGPEGDWKIIFTITVALILLISFLNIYIFVKVNRGEIFVIEESSDSRETLNVNLLKETVLYYHGKATKLESILNGQVTQVVDPSL